MYFEMLDLMIGKINELNWKHHLWYIEADGTFEFPNQFSMVSFLNEKINNVEER